MIKWLNLIEAMFEVIESIRSQVTSGKQKGYGEAPWASLALKKTRSFKDIVWAIGAAGRPLQWYQRQQIVSYINKTSPWDPRDGPKGSRLVHQSGKWLLEKIRHSFNDFPCDPSRSSEKTLNNWTTHLKYGVIYVFLYGKLFHMFFWSNFFEE